MEILCKYKCHMTAKPVKLEMYNLTYRQINNTSRAVCYSNIERGLINHVTKTAYSFILETTNYDQRGNHPSNNGTITENGLFCICEHPLNDMFSNESKKKKKKKDFSITLTIKFKATVLFLTGGSYLIYIYFILFYLNWTCTS